MMIGAGPRLPVRRFSHARCQSPASPGRELLLLERRRAIGPDDLRRAHAAAPAMDGMPDTFVG